MLFQLIVTFALGFCLSESFGRCCAVWYYNPRVTTLLTVRKTRNHCFCVLLDTWCWDPCGTYWTIYEASLQFNNAIQLCSGVFLFLCKAYFSLIFFSTFPSHFHLRDARICHAWSKCRWSFLHCPPEPETRSVWPNSCSGFKVLGWQKEVQLSMLDLSSIASS